MKVGLAFVDNWYIAQCLEYYVATQGHTLVECMTEMIHTLCFYRLNLMDPKIGNEQCQAPQEWWNEFEKGEELGSWSYCGEFFELRKCKSPY